MSITRFTFCILLATSVFLSGCELFSNHTNPILGWQVAFKSEPSPAVEKDAQDYISKLPAEERKYAGTGFWLTDGKGQHALTIPVALNGTEWTHVLIYDQNDKRIRVVKYISAHYRC